MNYSGNERRISSARYFLNEVVVYFLTGPAHIGPMIAAFGRPGAFHERGADSRLARIWACQREGLGLS
jgi:hypothetical protein